MAEEQEDVFNLDLNSLTDEGFFDTDTLTADAAPIGDGKKKVSKVIENDFIDTDNIGDIEDETEDTTETSGKNPDGSTPIKVDKDSSPFFVFASSLHKRGLLSDFSEDLYKEALEETEGDEEEAINLLFEQEIEKRQNGMVDAMSTEQREYLHALQNGIPDKVFREVKSKELEYSKIDDTKLSTDVELQKQVYRNYLKETTMLSDEKIEKRITQAESLDELSSEATDALNELKVINKGRIEQEFKAAQENAKQEQAKAKAELDNLKATIDAREEIIPGFKVNKKLKDSLYKNMTTAVSKDPKTGTLYNNIAAKRAENPLEFELKMQYLFELTKGFEDFSSLTNKVTTKATTTLKDVLERNTDFIGSKFATNGKNATRDNDGDNILSSFKTLYKKGKV